MYHLNINFGPLHFTTALIYDLALNTNVNELWTVKRRQNMVPYFSLILYEYIVEFIQYFLFDLTLYVPSTIFQLYRDGSSWVDPVLRWDQRVLLKDTMQ